MTVTDLPNFDVAVYHGIFSLHRSIQTGIATESVHLRLWLSEAILFTNGKVHAQWGMQSFLYEIFLAHCQFNWIVSQGILSDILWKTYSTKNIKLWTFTRLTTCFGHRVLIWACCIHSCIRMMGTETSLIRCTREHKSAGRSTCKMATEKWLLFDLNLQTPTIARMVHV